MFNVSNFVYLLVSIDVGSFLKNQNIGLFNCRDSPFIDKDHCHIMSKDLMIVENSKLCKLICKESKFTEKCPSFSMEPRKICLKV